jgi:hypothetical protein
MRSAPALDEAFLAMFDSAVRMYGHKPVMQALEMRRLQLTVPTGGRPPIDDSERLKRMEYHLLYDPDLAGRNRDGDKRLLSEAGRRAVCDSPRDGDLKPDGTPYEKAVDRLVDKFGFGFDIGGRGWDKGRWDGKRPTKAKGSRKPGVRRRAPSRPAGRRAKKG